MTQTLVLGAKLRGLNRCASRTSSKENGNLSYLTPKLNLTATQHHCRFGEWPSSDVHHHYRIASKTGSDELFLEIN